MNQIFARTTQVHDSLEIGLGSSILAQSVKIGTGVKIGERVSIVGDEVVIEDGVRIGSDVRLISPSIRLCASSRISGNLEAEFNEYFEMGAFSNVGKHVVMIGQGFRCGEYLWMKERVVVGGGGARGPRSYLTVGDHTSIFDGCYINLSESVSIGSHSALSANVSLLTHAAWQPALMGFATKFGPIEIGDYTVVYLNTSVMPGLKIGDYTTIAASSLVNSDIPSRCLAAGVPAVVKKGPENYPQPLSEDQKFALIHDILEDYLSSLPGKGITILADRFRTDGYADISVNGATERIALLMSKSPLDSKIKPLFSIALEDISPDYFGETHFDLRQQKMLGTSSALAEDFRDYLRRRAIRVITGSPYTVLPQTNLARLKTIQKNGLHK